MSRYADVDALMQNIRRRLGIASFDNLLESEKVIVKEIDSAPSINICFCEECMFADEEPIADGRYWCALHQCFMHFCSDGKRSNE